MATQLRGKRSTILDHQVESQPVPQHLMTSTSEDLFDFIASTLEQFVGKRGANFQLPPDKRQLGFTFSFPVRQTSVSSGILIKWTKGFAIENMAGIELVLLIICCDLYFFRLSCFVECLLRCFYAVFYVLFVISSQLYFIFQDSIFFCFKWL